MQIDMYDTLGSGLVYLLASLPLVATGRFFKLLFPQVLSAFLVEILEGDIEHILIPDGRETREPFLDVLQTRGLAHTPENAQFE
jgi:hypothetical protein